MKKVLPLILCFYIGIVLVSCKKATEFDNKKIAKIETTTTEGFYFGSPPIYKRIFDFTKGRVLDITLADEELLELLKDQYEKYPETYKEYPALEDYEVYLNSSYNTYSEVTTFEEEEGKKFLSEILSLGIYFWEDEYRTDDVIYDAAGTHFTILFTDGTSKETYFYFDYPKNYKNIIECFLKYFQVNCFR